MNLKSPRNTKKTLLIIIPIIALVTVVGSVLYLFNNDNVNNNTGNNGNLPVFTNLKIDNSFFTALNSIKNDDEELPPLEPVPPKPVTQNIEKTPDPNFEDIFITSNNTNTVAFKKNDVQKFLNLSNQSGEILTFKTFDELNLTEADNTADNPINTYYQSKNTKASYPVDFARVLTADRNINAILVNDINSSLGGKVIAQIEDNIYAAHGRKILIPIGSKAIGYYQPLTKVGHTRLQINWSRIITPKGVNINIDSELADQMGRSGLAGEVDNRFFDKYGTALLVSTINALSQIQLQTNNTNQSIFINTYGKDASNITAKMIEENLDIKPIITINAGARILLSPLEDIWFREINGNINVQPYSFSKLSLKDNKL